MNQFLKYSLGLSLLTFVACDTSENKNESEKAKAANQKINAAQEAKQKDLNESSSMEEQDLVLNKLTQEIEGGDYFNFLRNAYRPEDFISRDDYEKIKSFKIGPGDKNEEIRNYMAHPEASSYFKDGVLKLMHIEGLENDSKHLFISRSEGSMPSNYEYCLVYDAEKGVYNLKWTHNESLYYMATDNGYQFLTMFINNTNWRPRAIKEFYFKNNYLHEKEVYEISYNYSVEKSFKGSELIPQQYTDQTFLEELNAFKIRPFDLGQPYAGFMEYGYESTRIVDVSKKNITITKKEAHTGSNFPGLMELELKGAANNRLTGLLDTIGSRAKDFHVFREQGKVYILKYEQGSVHDVQTRNRITLSVYELISDEQVRLTGKIILKAKVELKEPGLDLNEQMKQFAKDLEEGGQLSGYMADQFQMSFESYDRCSGHTKGEEKNIRKKDIDGVQKILVHNNSDDAWACEPTAAKDYLMEFDLKKRVKDDYWSDFKIKELPARKYIVYSGAHGGSDVYGLYVTLNKAGKIIALHYSAEDPG